MIFNLPTLILMLALVVIVVTLMEWRLSAIDEMLTIVIQKRGLV